MDKIIEEHICLLNEGDKAVGWWAERYGITSLIRGLLSRKSKGVIGERCDKSKCRLINYMYARKKGHDSQSGLFVLHLTADI